MQASRARPQPQQQQQYRDARPASRINQRRRHHLAPVVVMAASSSVAGADNANANANAADAPSTFDPAQATARYFPAQGDRRPIILYDGVCNLCNGAVDLMLRLDPNAPGRFRLAALQSDCGRALLRRSGRAPDDISSIVLVEPDAFHVRSEAVRRIAAGLGALTLLPVLAAAARPVPLALRDAAYDAVADNRYGFFGRARECRLSDRSPAREFEERFVTY